MQMIDPSAPTGVAAIGRRVREARKEQDIRQDELAIAAGVSTRTVHQIEHGKPTGRLDTLARVLDVLGLALTVTERSRVHPASTEAGDGR